MDEAVLRGGPADGCQLKGDPKYGRVYVPVIDPDRRVPPIVASWRIRRDERRPDVEYEEWWDAAAGEWVAPSPLFVQALYDRTGETDAEGRAVFAFVPDPRGGQTQSNPRVS